MAQITLDHVEKTQARTAGHVLSTPLMGVGPSSRKLGISTRLKPETRQEAASSKLPGDFPDIVCRKGATR